MKLLRDASPVAPSLTHAAIALGNFDGLHLGHQAILQETLTQARTLKVPAAVLTFDPHPRQVLRSVTAPLTIMSLTQKFLRLREMGFDYLRVIRFTPAFSQLRAQEFIEQVLVKSLQVSHVVTGDDFIFGHKREGTVNYLTQIAAQSRFGYVACAPVSQGGTRVSSSRIREALAAGDIATAGALLGRPYSILGHVRKGDQRGRTLGFPTANMVPDGLFLPRTGVYAVRAVIGRACVNGVANLGIRPTFNGTRLQLEVHFIGWEGDLYGQRLEIEFVAPIRGEQRFSGPDLLKRQIASDIEAAQAHFQRLA